MIAYVINKKSNALTDRPAFTHNRNTQRKPSSRSVLLALSDSNRADRLRAHFRASGCHVATAQDGPEAARHVAACNGEAYGLVVMDDGFSGDGFELLRDLRRTAMDGKVMMISSDVCPDTCEASRQLAVDHLAHDGVEDVVVSRSGAVLLRQHADEVRRFEGSPEDSDRLAAAAFQPSQHWAVAA